MDRFRAGVFRGVGGQCVEDVLGGGRQEEAFGALAAQGLVFGDVGAHLLLVGGEGGRVVVFVH
ncbi:MULTISPECIES: hypothetical protein [Streptomyces]|uniref:hypothetical protein n=1 Tax=Streptomyces TaxID=1883 RepID=UPI00133196D2|nr:MULTISPECIES: hypothetical protein [Streptomyces]